MKSFQTPTKMGSEGIKHGTHLQLFAKAEAVKNLLI